MSASTASKLDTERFRKVHALMTGGATEGERAAAKARAEAMAARAGISLAQAIKLATKRESPAARAAREWADQMERKRREEEERQRRVHEEHERRRRQQEQEAIRKYGPADVIFAESDEERRLSAAVERFKQWCEDPAFAPHVEALSGWTANAGIETLPADVAAAIREATPFPQTVREAWSEVQRWEAILAPRYAYDSNYEPELWVAAREDMLRPLLFNLCAESLDDIRARELWRNHQAETGCWWHTDTERIVARMRMDAEWLVHLTLMKVLDRAAPRDTAPKTASDRHRNVLSILDNNPNLPDREIARRCGVSPTTVGKLRRKTAAA